MTKRQYKYAFRVLRANGLEFTRRFFRSYPERLAALERIEAQERDALDDRAYMAALVAS